MGDELVRKRRVIELGHLEARLTRGRGGFHLENVDLMPALVRLGCAAVGLLARGERNALRPVVRRLRLACAELPPALSGFTILHLSDLHIDGIAGLPERIRGILAELPVDLCVMTGDYRFAVHGPCHNVEHHMATVLSGVRARHGVVGILGNHDFAEIADGLRRQGVRMLVNEAHEVRQDGAAAWVVGLDDPHYYGCDDLAGAMAGVPAGAFSILLAHTPELAEEAARAGIGLYLCGHTHGGQICLPFLGPIWLNAACARRFTRGAWRCGDMQGFTSAGVGSSGYPVRFNCPPEIGLIQLVCPRHAAAEDGGRHGHA